MKSCHTYVKSDKSQKMLYTYTKLGKVHRNISCPGSDILFIILKHTQPCKTIQKANNV